MGISHLKALTKLEKLDLFDLPITDRSLNTICKLENLDRIGLERTDITDVGAIKLLELPRLQEIYLTGTKVSDDLVGKLRLKFPNAVITI